MKRITKHVVAGSVAAAVIVGGAGSFALWSDTADFSGGSINSGTLAVHDLGSSWTDVSPDRADGGKSIDLASFSAVPGDTLEGTYKVDVELTGDNMVAEVRLDSAALSGTLAAGVDVTYDLYVGGVERVSDAALGTGTSNVIVRASELTAAPGAEDVKVVVTAKFDPNASTSLQNASASLSGLGVNVTQVRAGHPDFN